MNRLIIFLLISLALQVKATTNIQNSILKPQTSNPNSQTSSLNSQISNPRVFPQKQATHFCQLLCDTGDGRVYPLSIYAQHLTALLCGSLNYGEYSANQVLTGLIFFYNDWEHEPMPFSNGQGRVLIEELHSGQTLRVFPHPTGGALTWYAPTDSLPPTIGAENQKYIHEAFNRLKGEVQAGEWDQVDTFIDRMIEYQCQFGNNTQAASLPKPSTIALWFIPLLALMVACSRVAYKRKDNQRNSYLCIRL